MAAKVTTIVFDAVEPPRLGRFWSETPFILLFLPTQSPKSVKNRVHLDLNPVGCDQLSELDRLLALGARHVNIGQGEQPWVVLADPEANEFCLLERRLD